MLSPIALALLTGRLIALDSQPIAGVRVIVRWSEQSVLGAVDTLPVDSTGRFGALARDSAGDSVSFVIDALPASRYEAARLVVPRSRLAEEVRILLVPKRWIIRRGRFAGAEVAIDPAAALRRVPDFGSFGRVSATRVVGWIPGSFPIPIVLRHDGASRISAIDSVAFWDATHDVEDALGGRFFVPWTDTTMRGRIYPVDVRIDRKIPGVGITFITWDSGGNIFEGSVRFRASQEMRIAGIVQHELMHVLGFGHTMAWPSAMETRTSRARVVTPEDVGYAQLLLAVHASQQDALVVGGFIEARASSETLPPGSLSSHFPLHDIPTPLASRERHPRIGDSPNRR
jgi:hypothetical protein